MKGEISDTPSLHPGARLTRRASIQAGAIGLMGLGVNHLAKIEALAADQSRRPKSVIYIFLSGGLAQHETFDMKPEAPIEIRGEFKSISTATPGLHISEHLPELAKRSETWSLCRSVTHPWNEHSQGHHIMLTGRTALPPGFDPRMPKESDWPSIAAIANNHLPVDSSSQLPNTIVLPEKLVHRTGRTLPGQFGGQLGAQSDPFFLEASRYNAASYGAYPDRLFHHRTGVQSGEDFRFDVPSLTLPQGIDRSRMENRLGLLKHLDEQQGHLESLAEVQPMGEFQQKAAAMLFDPKVKAAFDVMGAPQKDRERYGENAFGWSLLLARQLVESGTRLVQVNLGNNECWDNHENIFHNLKDFLLPPMDRGVSALLDDLGDRGLLEDTMVVMASEFGRTPKIFKIAGATYPGRDHWGAVQTVFFAGGGVKGGRVIGSSDKMGAYPDSDPQTPENFAATIYQALGFPRNLNWHDRIDRPHPVYQSDPIDGLF